MTGPHPSVAAVRLAVRECLASLSSLVGASSGPVLVACSGGPDSLALAAALAFEGERLVRTTGSSLSFGAVIVDQGWQNSSSSSARLAALADTLTAMGLAPVLVVEGHDPLQTETTARAARYDAFAKAQAETGAIAVLLGHTAADQAEQVLLGLVRGSGTRSLAGIPPVRGSFVRPLLALQRSVTEEACAALELIPYVDPSNADVRHLRARVRHEVLPYLESSLGPGVAAALQRTAELARSDADALDALAADYLASFPIGSPPEPELSPLSVSGLAQLHPAVLRRVLLMSLRSLGSEPGAEHLLAAADLVLAWRGQGPLHLPGGVQVSRQGGRIVLSPSAPPSPSAAPEGVVPRD